MIDLGTLGGPTSAANGVSDDGLIIVGQTTKLSLAQVAFSWTAGGGMVNLSPLTGTQFTSANAVSADGSVIVGEGKVDQGGSVFTSTVMRWTQAGGSVDLGVLAGYTEAFAYDVSADGEILIGTATNDPLIDAQAFMWSQTDGMVSLGSLGGTLVYASGISADGSVIVGTSTLAPGEFSQNAFRWTRETGMRSVKELLTAGGVDTTGISLVGAAVSADGRVLAGTALGPVGINGWVAFCESALCTGLVDPVNIANSFSSVGAVGQTGNAFVGGQLATLTETATQYKESSSPLSFTGSGFYDSDPVGAANIGATYDLGGDILIGGSLGESLVDTPMLYDGESRIFGTSLAAFVASNPDEGLQWLIGANASYFTGSIDREYINGIAIARSSGDVKGNGYGAIARAGYSLKVADDVRVTLFASYTASKVHIDGYTETTGPVPAQFDDIDDEAQISRLGSDLRYNFTPDTWTWGTLAWAHRLDDGSSNISGTLAGALPLTTPGVEAADDWVEATAGLRLPLSEGASLTTSVTAVMPSGGYDTTFQARVGLAYAF